MGGVGGGNTRASRLIPCKRPCHNSVRYRYTIEKTQYIFLWVTHTTIDRHFGRGNGQQEVGGGGCGEAKIVRCGFKLTVVTQKRTMALARLLALKVTA